MPTGWRQGDLLAPDDAVGLQVIETMQRNTHRVLIVSHSCDIASDEGIEPSVELLIGTIVDQTVANHQNGHSIRTLHLGAECFSTIEWVQYGISQRREIPKAKLLQHEPWTECRYTGEQRALLRRWLAQRYARCEFPDAFISWLRESNVGRRFEGLGKKSSPHLVGIYFDFEDDTEREDPSDPYELGINLVYDASNADHVVAAEHTREQLEDLFTRCCKPNDEWRWIELTYCDVVSEDVFSLRAARMFRRWRFEHRSLGGEPMDTAE